ncbi:hypothetical protein ACFQ3R_04060 [Mesonia ostreae]|uniref:Lipoprotein n=1 Tax=Mesonia ostreae TaxID=861110 RepID=A0ABU2KIY7_9FLAO|nr:hypothetical protein [Mesonia ostreae]MDT0294677.1 hypothetical protein [Mesonia ostreae]
MIKNFLVLFGISFLLQSCFYTHRAKKIDAYELIQNKEETASKFVFEYPGNKKDFEKKSISFFRLDTSYMPFNFTTDQLYPDEELNVLIITSRDKDVMVNLLGYIIRESLKTDNENLNKDEDPNPDTTYYYFVHIQVTDKEGNDVLAGSSMRSKAIINKLLKYKHYLN